MARAAEPEGESAKTEKITVRPGMELKRVGGINLVIPEGAKVYQEGSHLAMEEPEEYAARRFKEMDARITAIENRQKEMTCEIDKLKTPR